MKSVVLILFGLLAAGCSQSEKITPRQDPLIGKIYAKTGQSLSKKDVFDQAAKADVIYLGESHENKEQHKIQLEILEDLIKRGETFAIGMEFYFQSQSSLLMSYVDAKPNKDPEKEKKAIKNLRKRLGWEKAKDKTWNKYFAFIELAKKYDLQIFGADLPRSLNYRISRVGWAGLTPIEQMQAPLGVKPPAAYNRLMKKRFTASHCGWSEEKLLARLYETWRARNEAMARAVVAMKPKGGKVVMILGGGHTENNMAVVAQVKGKKPTWKQLNLGLTEISLEPEALAAYLAPQKIAGMTFQASHDIFWFTGRHSWVHPCKRFEKQLAKHKATKK